jgi:ATP-dependent RNA helicase RhlB
LYLVRTRERFAVLYNLITRQNLKRVLVFCNRRDQTRRLADRLKAHDINCAVLSGEVAQKKRIRTLEDFRSGNIRVLVATDVAGRGIHIDDISHVVNYNLPLDVEDYVHRIGRTGRAGATGASVGFATEDESFQIPAIEKYLGESLRCVYPDDALLTPVPPPTASVPSQPPPRAPWPRHRRTRGGT